MLIQTLLNSIIGFVQAIFDLLPTATLADLPIIGTTVSDTLETVIETWNAFMVTFPYAVTLWDVFIFVILPFEILLLVAKFLLGHRVPAHTTN